MNRKQQQCLISVVIPVFNSTTALQILVAQLHEFFDHQYPAEREIILVNDGSKNPETYKICKEFALKDKRVKFISLFKNFGQIAAVLTGLRQAKGDYIIIMDDDLQNPVKDILLLLNTIIEQDYDFVYGIPKKKSHNLYRRGISKLNERMSELLWRKPSEIVTSSFLVLKKQLVTELIKYEGPFPYLSGLIFRVSQNGTNVFTEHHPRQFGKSQYSFYKLFKLSLNGATNFSILPLRIAMLVGILFATLGILSGGVIVVAKLLGYQFSYGWASIICTLLFTFGVQFLFMWMLGEYIGRSFLLLNKAPQAAIRETINCEINAGSYT